MYALLAPTLLSLVAQSGNVVNGTNAEPPAPTPAAAVTAAMPADFADLDRKRVTVLDVYFGDRRIGQFEVEADPASLRFFHPDAVAAAIPDLLDRASVTAALTGALPPHAAPPCASSADPCDRPRPLIASIVYDPARYRITIYVNPRLLAVRDDGNAHFLTPPSSAPTAIDTMGFAIAGGSGQRPSYALRNRLVAGAGNAHLIAEMAISSFRGLDIDSLTAQLDRPGHRYIAGLFYAPGTELVGRRRIVGLGVGSQFDTRIDRSSLTGTPLILFLDRRARVDLYVQGRLIGSQSLESGNQTLDTTTLPDGSYMIELHIHDAGGAQRVERRFFTKNAALAPVGYHLFHAEIGWLAAAREDMPVAITSVPILNVGLAGRRGAHLAWDASGIVTDRKILAEIGVTVITPALQGHVGLLASSTGDRGVAIQLNSTNAGWLNYGFDLRHVRSADGRTLIPIEDDSRWSPLAGVGLAPFLDQSPDYVQATGSVSAYLRRTQWSLSAYYRRGRDGRASYAVGPALRWTIVERDRFRLGCTGTYAATDRGNAVAFGLQFQLLGARSQLHAAIRGQSGGGASSSGGEEAVELGASVQRDDRSGGLLNASALTQFTRGATLVQAGADARGPAGYVAGAIVQRLKPGADSRQYGLSGQTTLGWGGGTLHLGAREQTDSVIAVRVRGPKSSARFEVLVDEAVRGVLHPGERLAVAVQPYRRYAVRLRVIGDQLWGFDTRTRRVDMHPGSYRTLEWSARPVLAMFGRLVTAAGAPFRNGDITSEDAVAATDDHGYFQIQAAGNASLTVHAADGATCTATLDARHTTAPFVALGDVPCRP
ncbi:hypothetical protein BRX43_04825 [Sphingomonas sp. S-NIH.Pt15_0812]|nr:hypothetical protein BRX43_04825 [Sphingomonas sp. S-NIH.Pt15_0812]